MHSTTFILGEKKSIAFAFANLDELHKNNERDKRHFKSFRSLNCSIENLKRSFYFLKDCIYFCKDELIYNNQELLSNLRFLETSVILTYLDTEPGQIPYNIRENYAFGKAFELDKNLDEKQLSELKLINWRDKEHWAFWAVKYGTESPLGKYCQEQANKRD